MIFFKNKRLRQIWAVLESGNLLFLKLLLTKRGKANVYPGMVFRDYMSLVEKDRWRSRDIFELLGVEQGVRLTIEHMPGQGIGTPVDELAYLAILTQVVKPQKIFEIGTFRGRTALNFALNSPEPCVVYTMDLPPADRTSFKATTNRADAHIIDDSVTGMDYKGKGVEHKIRQLFGNSLEFDFSPYGNAIDIVFVDGAHHYEAAYSDTENALKMVKPGGWIIWHDFANYGDYNDVTRAILDLIPNDQVNQIANSQLAAYRHPF